MKYVVITATNARLLNGDLRALSIGEIVYAHGEPVDGQRACELSDVNWTSCWIKADHLQPYKHGPQTRS